MIRVQPIDGGVRLYIRAQRPTGEREEMVAALTWEEMRELMTRLGLVLAPEYPADVLGPELLERMQALQESDRHAAEAGE